MLIAPGQSAGVEFWPCSGGTCGRPCLDVDSVTVLGLSHKRASLILSCANVGIFKQLCLITLFSTDDPFCNCFDRNKILLFQLSQSWWLPGQRRYSSCFVGWNIFTSLGDSDLMCLFALLMSVIWGLHELFLVSPQCKKYQELYLVLSEDDRQKSCRLEHILVAYVSPFSSA